MAALVFLKNESWDFSLQHLPYILVYFALVPNKKSDTLEVLLPGVILGVFVPSQGFSNDQVSFLEFVLVMLGLLKEVHGLFQQCRS